MGIEPSREQWISQLTRLTLRADSSLTWDVAAASSLQSGDDAAAFQRVRGDEPWKRTLDIVVAVVSLIITAPLCLLVSILIKLTSPGPILFRQERVGVDRRLGDRRQFERAVRNDRRGSDRRRFVKFGKPFTMYKFRTMYDGAEVGNPKWAEPGDPRVTPLGRILRRARIDEIPQFLNVLKGDMSVVGPRPERSFFIVNHDQEIPEFKLRLRTKPGITGLAQISQGYANSVDGMRRKLIFDLEYIRQMSPATDLKILLNTIGVVVTGRGAW